jgi:hypothetical protein
MTPPRRPLTDHAGLGAEALAAVRAHVEPHATLEHVLASTRGAVEEIVTQDEYTHDVVVRYRDGDLYLVYDTT